MFSSLVEASEPRAARTKMKEALGLKSLSGVVHSCVELPLLEIAAIARIIGQTRLELPALTRALQDEFAVLTETTGPEFAAWQARTHPTPEPLASIVCEAALAPPVAPEPAAVTVRAARYDPFAADTATHVLGGTVPAGVTLRPSRAPSRLRTRAHVDWSAVKARYLFEGRSIKKAAAAFGLPANTVKARARREGW